MLDKRTIFSFLHYGYLPALREDVMHEPWAQRRAEEDDPTAVSFDESLLIAEGVSSLKTGFLNVSEGTHVVPLSGGLDSRSILGGLLGTGLKDQTIAVTFGTPGTLDYEIPAYVAKKVGVLHEKIDLTQVELTQAALERTIIEGDAWTYLFPSFYYRLICQRFGKDVTYWNGFMADGLAGSHLFRKDSESWEVALHRYAERDCFSRSVRLTPSGFRPEEVLPQSSFLPESGLSYDDQLGLSIREQAAYRPVVLTRGYRHRTPYICEGWVDFILGLPRDLRRHKSFYKEILRSAYPLLFSLPTKTNFGLPLDAPRWRSRWRQLLLDVRYAAERSLPRLSLRPHPFTSYIDFNRGLREREDFRTLVDDNIQDLKGRGIVDWLDLDEIWSAHQRGQANHTNALLLLTALEINLKVLDKSS